MCVHVCGRRRDLVGAVHAALVQTPFFRRIGKDSTELKVGTEHLLLKAVLKGESHEVYFAHQYD